MTWGPDDPRVLCTPNQPEPFKGIIFQNRGVLNPDTIMNAFNPFERQELRKAIIYDIGKEIPGLFHRYVYCKNNPILFIDLWGVCADGSSDDILITGTFFLRGVFLYYQKQPDDSYSFGLAIPTPDGGLYVWPVMGPFQPRPPKL